VVLVTAEQTLIGNDVVVQLRRRPCHWDAGLI